ncbi:hypothetical protein F4780DRAFT_715956 [Xylariomycetidae sp. FL0641]|nr:hypothetical protein F4780DRAFT_715956 [Xylariomycetidae sp. FL0641]
MGTSSGAGDGNGGTGGQDPSPAPGQPSDDQSGGTTSNFSQTLWILVFTGHPRDIQSARVTELYIVFNEDESTNLTIQLQGEHPSFRVNEIWNQRHPRYRPYFYRRLAVSTVPTSSQFDMRLRDTIYNAPVNNVESDWTCQSWVGDVLTFLQDANLISEEEGDSALNSMVNYISRAPWR